MNTLKVLGQSMPLAATLTDVYTVPALTQAVSSSLVVCNQSAVATSFRVAVRPVGVAINVKHYIYYDVAIAGNTTNAIKIGLSLGATDVVSVYATLATLSFNIFGQEYS